MLPSLTSSWISSPPSAARIAGASPCGVETAEKNFISETVTFVFFPGRIWSPYLAVEARWRLSEEAAE